MPQILTDRLVRTLEAPARGNRVAYDIETRGFGCRVTAAGAKSFILNYRAGGRERRYTLGSFPDWSTRAARHVARQLKREIDLGRDPMAERVHERQAPTVAALADRYLAEHVEVHNKPRTIAEVRRMVERLIKPRIGRLKVEAVGHDAVARLHRELKGTPRQANHVVAVLSKMFNLAELWQLRPQGSNPCRHLPRYPEHARDRFLAPAELERVGAALREMEAEGTIEPEVAACIRFLALVGCRLSEAVGATWGAIDLKAGAWTLPDAKAGPRRVMLGAPALVLLAAQRRVSDRVFGALTAGRVEKAWSGDHPHAGSRKRARPGIRDRAGIADARLHDLRHTMGTYAGGAGLNAFMVRDLLGHKTMAMAGRYVSRNADPMRQAADVVSGQIAAAMGGPAGELVPLAPPGGRARRP